VLANTVNSFELITHGKLSESSGQLDDAVLSGWSGTSLVGSTEAAGLRKIEVGVGLFQCRHEGRWYWGGTWYDDRELKANTLGLCHLDIISVCSHARLLLIRIRVLIAILVPTINIH